MTVSIKAMKKLIKDLEQQNKDLSEELGMKVDSDKFMIVIINKKGMSDTWEIEK